ncbi:hypothetical protein UAJ10_04160 [Nitrospirillum sp. BR 11164]|uniref:hypothetical protein n=1 Tax=Nitrospirillum sp. BR 11164 TaxID=3104324 RepID=UPI002B0015C3|nr:hypothetical protein [Nitrospirillum sp. BR 11164]MEA1648208.1 hypothetical protein [Nitrospirillum sp. BR 11164]
MPRLPHLLSSSVLALTLAWAPACFADTAAKPALSYSLTEGRNLNAFLRQGEVAAHLLLRSGKDARILVAFPAGNSSVGLWLDTADTANWTLVGTPQPVTTTDAKGRPLRGVVFEAALKADSAVPRQGVLSSTRVLRDYEALRTLPTQVQAQPTRTKDALDWARDRLDGNAGYRLTVTVTHGQLTDGGFKAGADGTIGLRVTALTGETPLTPLAGDQLLNASAAAQPASRDALTFLSYQEKLLAGSWRFHTYFGRDTLMSVMLLMPALQPDAVQAGLRSVLARLSPDGQVAHEEDIGEFAILDHLKAGGGMSDAPVYDYKMVDSDFLLAPVARAWLLDDPRGRAAAAGFLAAADGRHGQVEAAGAALVRNLRRVVAQAAPFAAAPGVETLVRLKPGQQVGEWRDSNTGLGGGVYPYDVNAILVPAALDAADALLKAKLLDPWLDAAARADLTKAADLAKVWRAKAPALFDVTVAPAEARRDVAAYAAKAGVPAEAALAALPKGPVRFHALSLNADGTPVPVLHSDEGFALLFDHPTAEALDAAVAAADRPFPAGLMTGVGMLVANPAYAPAATQDLFPRSAYHGTVVWSWQQALTAAGLTRQLSRTDLPAATRARLTRMQTALWRDIEAAKGVQSSELWSWDFRDGHYIVAPYGAAGNDADESNAAQLWSTVFLAVQPPGGQR